MSTEPPVSPGRPVPSRPIPFFSKLFATGLFAGFIPGPTGTWGSLLGAGCYYVLPGTEEPLLLALIIGVAFFAGAYASNVVAERTGHRLTRAAELAKATFQPASHASADPSIVVIDEIVGMWASLLLLPKSLPILILAFCFFRLYDIVKPYPARLLERVPRGWGIMLDDLVAAVYANVSSHVVLLLARAFLPVISLGWSP